MVKLLQPLLSHFSSFPPAVSEDVQREALQAAYFPRISRDEQQAAQERLAVERAKFEMVRLPDGRWFKWATGVIDFKDLRLANGYGVSIGGCDRFGWPKGHPDSPATPD